MYLCILITALSHDLFFFKKKTYLSSRFVSFDWSCLVGVCHIMPRRLGVTKSHNSSLPTVLVSEMSPREITLECYVGLICWWV